MSPTQIEEKVENYLRTAATLQEQWQQPTTRDELQAEMDRIARNTKRPDVLRELFGVLDNDPFLIAECLVKPILVERMVTNVTDDRDGPPDRPPNSADDSARSAVAPGQIHTAAYALPEISVPLDCTDNTWTPTSTSGAPTGRVEPAAVWTGSEMIVWGGVGSGFIAHGNGGRYNPATDTWTATRTTGAPSARVNHTAVWTGSEMIVWGGSSSIPGFNTGGRYNPSTDSWTSTSTINAPGARAWHTAVWAGDEMIVWGGALGSGPVFNTGGRYDPSTNSWMAISVTNAPGARESHKAVWTGREMIIWGGDERGSFFNTGGRYNPSTDTWTATSTTDAPAGRFYFTAVWTGREMIVWGGTNGGSLNTGGRYDPHSDSWTATATSGSPDARFFHTAVWTDGEMIAWGGTSNNSDYLNTGGRYNPITDSWRATSTASAPTARAYHRAVWTGSEMILWGGLASCNNCYLKTGGKYCVQPSAAAVQSAVSRKTHGSVGNFDVDLPLTGTAGIECRSGSATNDYTIVVAFLANISVNGNPQASVISGIGTIGRGGAGNGGMVTISGNVVTIPLTNVTNAQTINVMLNNVNGSTNVTIPMRVLIGDVNGTGAVNSSDVVDTKMCAGQTVSSSNFRCDVDAGGAINATDVSMVKSQSGTALP